MVLTITALTVMLIMFLIDSGFIPNFKEQQKIFVHDGLHYTVVMRAGSTHILIFEDFTKLQLPKTYNEAILFRLGLEEKYHEKFDEIYKYLLTKNPVKRYYMILKDHWNQRKS